MSESRMSRVSYWSLVEPVWLPLNRSWDDGPEDFIRQFRAVMPEIGHLYAAHWCQSEVRNGGLHQFFLNTTGILAPEALEGFGAIGTEDWGAILAQAMKHFGTPYPRRRADRLALIPILHGLPRKEWDPFGELDHRFYKWAGNWENAANVYAERIATKNRD
jgi:hypothetical protein